MHVESAPAFVLAGALLLVAGVGAAGCSGPLGFGPFHFKMAALPPPPLKPPAYALDATPPAIGLAQLLDPAFYPPGATKIAPDRAGGVTLVPATRAAFPSDVQSASPNGGTVLITATRQMGNSLHHELVAVTNRMRQTLYSTTKQFWTLWSPDGKRIAVTVFAGGNASYVFVIDVASGSYSPPLAPLDGLIPPFTESERYAPQWVVAYAWTPAGKLVVRGTGVSGQQAPTAFGYEVLAEVAPTAAPTFTLLRAYRLADRRD